MSAAAAPIVLHWPGQCELCRRWTRGRLCAGCAPEGAVARCVGCGLRLADGAMRCGACLAHPLPLDCCVCAVDYTAPWDHLVQRFKYHAAVDLAPALADRLADAVGASPVDVVVPMPMAPRRLAERGFNQAWELARRVAHRLGLAADPRLLLRLHDRAPQAGLDRAARRRNLQGVFAVVDREAVAGRRLALVDDVLTTGATIAEAAQALHAAGAAEVHAWVLARTP